jgi:hypothetical protein
MVWYIKKPTTSLKILSVLLEKKKLSLKGNVKENFIQLVLAFNSSLLKGEVRASKQQQGPTSWASPVGRCPTSWIFVPYIVPTE